MIISRTPYRVSFFGGGTDYPSWYLKSGGQVISTTIDKYCYITCRYLPPFFDHNIRIAYSQIELCNSLDEIKHPSVREALRKAGITNGIEIHHDGDMPARSGVGSSSSFTVGLLNAIYGLKGEKKNKEGLLADSIDIEQNVLGETVGSQDQTMAVYGGFNHITFNKTGVISVEKMNIPETTTLNLNSHLMLFFTGLTRISSNVAKTYIKDININEKRLTRIGSMVDDAISILKTGKDLRTFGELLHETWMEKRALGSSISTDKIDEIYTKARNSGATGGKLIGAGGGGFMLLFVPPENQINVRKSLTGLLEVPFQFEEHGSQIIFKDEN